MGDEEERKYRCTECGRIGTVGRCCGRNTLVDLSDLANFPPPPDSEKWATNASDGDGVSDLYEDAPKEERDWLIFYEDTACPPNHFGGTEAHAKKMLEEAGQNWTCHLYKRVASA